EAAPCGALQGPDLDLLEVSAHLVDPGALLPREEPALTDVVRNQCWADRRVPVASGDRRLGAMDAVARRFDVDARAGGQLEPDRVAGGEGALGQQAPQLRQQRRERRIRSRRKRSRPERLDELLTARYSVAMDSEVCEQKAALPAGQLVLDPPAVNSRDE